MPHGSDCEIVVNEDESELCIEGFSQCLKKDLVQDPGVKRLKEW